MLEAAFETYSGILRLAKQLDGCWRALFGIVMSDVEGGRNVDGRVAVGHGVNGVNDAGMN